MLYGKPRFRSETYSGVCDYGIVLVDIYVMDGKVVDAFVENHGQSIKFDVIKFVKTSDQWSSYLRLMFIDSAVK